MEFVLKAAVLNHFDLRTILTLLKALQTQRTMVYVFLSSNNVLIKRHWKFINPFKNVKLITFISNIFLWKYLKKRFSEKSGGRLHF